MAFSVLAIGLSGASGFGTTGMGFDCWNPSARAATKAATQAKAIRQFLHITAHPQESKAHIHENNVYYSHEIV